MFLQGEGWRRGRGTQALLGCLGLSLCLTGTSRIKSGTRLHRGNFSAAISTRSSTNLAEPQGIYFAFRFPHCTKRRGERLFQALSLQTLAVAHLSGANRAGAPQPNI